MLNSDEQTISKFVIGDKNDDNSLIYSLNYKTDSIRSPLKEIIKKIIHTSEEAFNDDSLSLLDIEDIHEEKFASKIRWIKGIATQINNYENLWLYRWICLIVLGHLEKENMKALETIKLERLIKCSSHNVPHYIKYIPNVNLQRANLEGANLEGANLEETILTRANLRNAVLYKTRLYFTKLRLSDLSYAELNYAHLLQADLSQANLEGANLSNVNIDIPERDSAFYDAMFDIDLSLSNLYKIDISNAILQNAIIINPQLCDDFRIKVTADTDLHRAIIDDSNLIDYLEKFKAKIPKKITNKKELYKRIKSIDESPPTKYYMMLSRLPEE